MTEQYNNDNKDYKICCITQEDIDERLVKDTKWVSEEWLDGNYDQSKLYVIFKQRYDNGYPYILYDGSNDGYEWLTIIEKDLYWEPLMVPNRWNKEAYKKCSQAPRNVIHGDSIIVITHNPAKLVHNTTIHRSERDINTIFFCIDPLQGRVRSHMIMGSSDSDEDESSCYLGRGNNPLFIDTLFPERHDIGVKITRIILEIEEKWRLDLADIDGILNGEMINDFRKDLRKTLNISTAPKGSLPEKVSQEAWEKATDEQHDEWTQKYIVNKIDKEIQYKITEPPLETVKTEFLHWIKEILSQNSSNSIPENHEEMEKCIMYNCKSDTSAHIINELINTIKNFSEMNDKKNIFDIEECKDVVMCIKKVIAFESDDIKIGVCNTFDEWITTFNDILNTLSMKDEERDTAWAQHNCPGGEKVWIEYEKQKDGDFREPDSDDSDSEYKPESDSESESDSDDEIEKMSDLDLNDYIEDSEPAFVEKVEKNLHTPLDIAAHIISGRFEIAAALSAKINQPDDHSMEGYMKCGNYAMAKVCARECVIKIINECEQHRQDMQHRMNEFIRLNAELEKHISTMSKLILDIGSDPNEKSDHWRWATREEQPSPTPSEE